MHLAFIFSTLNDVLIKKKKKKCTHNQFFGLIHYYHHYCYHVKPTSTSVLRAHTNILEVMHKVILAKLVKIYESKLSFFLKVSLQTTSGKEKEYVYIELKYMSHYFERSDEDSTIDLASLLKL